MLSLSCCSGGSRASIERRAESLGHFLIAVPKALSPTRRRHASLRNPCRPILTPTPFSHPQSRSILSYAMPPPRPMSPCIRTFKPLYRRPQSQRPTGHLRPLSTKPQPQSPTIPVRPTCPPPACPCTSTTPPELEIDRTSPLLHTAPAYAHHVVVNTGKADWASRIQDEEEGGMGNVVKGLRGEIMRDVSPIIYVFLPAR